MRIHYACFPCLRLLNARADIEVMIVLRTDIPPVADQKKTCCFCPQTASVRVRTDAETLRACEPGHLPKGRFEELAREAFAQSCEENGFDEADCPITVELEPKE